MSNDKYLLKEINLSEYGLGTIYPLSAREIINLGEEGLKNFLAPFLYKSVVKDNDEDIRFFDYLFIRDEQMIEVLLSLINSLKVLYRCNDYTFDDSNPNYIKIIISEAKIDRNNFDKLCDIVRDMYFLNQIEEEIDSRTIQVDEANKAILEEYLRLEQEYKKEQEELAKKNQKTLHQIVTIVASQCLWDYDKVLEMSYYRLITTYKSIFEIDSYTTYLAYATSGQFDMKNVQQKHWGEIVGKPIN